MSNSMYKIYEISRQRLLNEYIEIHLQNANDMDAYNEYCREQNNICAKTKYKICKDEIQAMWAIQDGKIPKMISFQ